MERTVICRKSKKCIWEYIGGEIFLGLLFVIPVILAAALPVEESAFYVRYIFAGIGVFFSCFLSRLSFRTFVLPDFPKFFSNAQIQNFSTAILTTPTCEFVLWTISKLKFQKTNTAGHIRTENLRSKWTEDCMCSKKQTIPKRQNKP